MLTCRSTRPTRAPCGRRGRVSSVVICPNPMNEETRNLLHWRIASTSIGPSTARNMGPPGTIRAAQDFLAGLDLSRFAVGSEAKFRGLLDDATHDLTACLPLGAQNWGPARKFLNIFLRGVVYNKYLCSFHDLDPIEGWLEVPLDKEVARGLRDEVGGDELPLWMTVKRLEPHESSIYQTFAAVIAADKGIYRVHLDLYYWRKNKRADNKSFQPTRARAGAKRRPAHGG